MTTAPDLPIREQLLPAGQPEPAPTTRPLLSVVPEQLPSVDDVELDEALRRAAPRLQRYAARRLHDDHEAEEVVQEALLRAFQHRHLLATEDDLMAWLTVVTGRLVIDRLRVRGRSITVAEVPPQSRAARDTADVVVARDEARIALDALEAMPSRQAAVLWAREVEGLSYDEIGERFDMTEPSVRSVLHRARKTLRREYAVRGGSLPGVALVALAPWLRGLRVAGRLRHVARRGASAFAVAATGLAVVTVGPIGTPIHPTHPAATPAPALRIKAQEIPLRSHHAARHLRAPVAAPVVHAAAPRPVAPSQSHKQIAILGGCRHVGSHLRRGCDAPHSPTLYLKLPIPVAGNQEVGIANNNLPCNTIPTTVVTQCDGAPSRGNS